MIRTTLLTFTLFLIGSTVVADAEERFLFRFDDPEVASTWQTINDGVMGGRSDGRFTISKEGKLEFFGTLSLENNGGFASVRSSEARLGLAQGESLVMRVRGDGREYNVNLYVPRSLGRNSYRQSFQTTQHEWIDVTLPLDKFVATWRGRVFPDETFMPGNITGIGIQLSDKNAGPFKLEVDWIKAVKMP